ncbi:hypothetical protein H0H87_012046 [Tephrocybe sp. NHM501043]|nr:hypothetical protein H0H87_012046 [Tephrocybe sp. NHM501043]
MALKRTFERAAGSSDLLCAVDEAKDEERPLKRRHSAIPHTPVQRRSSFSAFQTPFTGTPYPSRPLDSPTNPVGRKRTKNLAHSLPTPTSFSKHLPLRFQFVRPGASPRMGGIYRVVQVPLSYTFVHLRCLIAFMFGGGFDDEREDKHLFEVKKKLSMYAMTYKPGQIRQGFTTFKLSTARDPCRYKPENDDILFGDDATQAEDGGNASQVISDSEEPDEYEDPTWKWELEEEFTLGHAWSRGTDIGCGIIYVRRPLIVHQKFRLTAIQHHNETTAVHITINTTILLPRRQGHSNTPYLFVGRGRVHIHPNTFLPLPKPVFSVPIRKLSAPSFRGSDWSTSWNFEDDEADEDEEDGNESDDKIDEAADEEDIDGESDPEVGDVRSCGFLDDGQVQQSSEERLGTEDEEEEEGGEGEDEDPNVAIGVKKFNAPHAFATYLRFVHQHTLQRQYPQSDESSSDNDDELLLHSGSTPALVHTSSSPISSSPIRSSSIAFPSSPSFINSPSRRMSLPYDPYVASLSTLTSLSTAAYTPAPPHAPWQRRRIERVEKRMQKYKKKAWMCSKDEGAEDAVDQLDEDVKPVAPPKGNWRTKLNRRKETDPPPLPPLWVKPKLKPGEIWDPFGDEIEV